MIFSATRFQLLFHVYDRGTFIAQGVTDVIEVDHGFYKPERFVGVLSAILGAPRSRQNRPGLTESTKNALIECWVAAQMASSLASVADHPEVLDPSIRVMQVIYL